MSAGTSMNNLDNISSSGWGILCQKVDETLSNPSVKQTTKKYRVDDKIPSAIEKKIANSVALYNLGSRTPETIDQVGSYKIKRLTRSTVKKKKVTNEQPAYRTIISSETVLKIIVKPWADRVLPTTIANDREGEKYIDPISNEEIFPSEAIGSKYIHVGPYILSVSSFIRRLLTDCSNYKNGLCHPLEPRILTPDEHIEVKEQLNCILTPKLAEHLFPTGEVYLKNQIYFSPGVLTTRIKIVLLFRERLSIPLLNHLNIGGWIEQHPQNVLSVISFPHFRINNSPLQVRIHKVLFYFIGRITSENNELNRAYTQESYRVFEHRIENSEFNLSTSAPSSGPVESS